MISNEIVHDICAQFSEKRRIRVTDAAQQLIRLLINCIEVDPQEAWDELPKPSEEYYREWADRLPSFLIAVARDHRLKQRLTAIDIVDWLGKNWNKVQINHCPFPKLRELPPTSGLFPWEASEE